MGRSHAVTWMTPKWPVNSRFFGSYATLQSGHNRWSKIRHDKSKEDALKSKARTILSKEIYLASRLGGADPDLNPRLAAAITNAKKGALTKAAIASSIARGQGRAADGAVLEHVNVEAMLPYGVAVIIECLTESKNRVLNDLRGTIKSSGGSITPTAFLFDRRGKIWFMEQDRLLVDDIFDDAIEAGATDIDDDQGKLVVVTEPHEVNRVAHVLGSKYALDVERSEIVHIPKEDSKVSLSDDQWAEIDVVLERLEQEPSLQNVFVNVAGRGLK